MEQSTREIELARINAETAKIAWYELQLFFAKGKAVAVSPELDVVAVAYELSVDNQKQFQSWMATGQVGVVADAQAKEWYNANALMWAIVIRPWVLVQPILQDEMK